MNTKERTMDEAIEELRTVLRTTPIDRLPAVLAMLECFMRANDQGATTEQIKAEFMPAIKKFAGEKDFTGCEIYFNGLYRKPEVSMA